MYYKVALHFISKDYIGRKNLVLIASRFEIIPRNGEDYLKLYVPIGLSDVYCMSEIESIRITKVENSEVIQ